MLLSERRQHEDLLSPGDSPRKYTAFDLTSQPLVDMEFDVPPTPNYVSYYVVK